MLKKVILGLARIEPGASYTNFNNPALKILCRWDRPVFTILIEIPLIYTFRVKFQVVHVHHLELT